MSSVLWPVATTWAWPLGWACVAAASVWWCWPRTQGVVKGSVWWVWGVAGLVAWLALWPQGGWSGYAALAFQSPSLLSVVWALAMLGRALGLAPARDDDPLPAPAWYCLCALGWCLTLDTLNLWPHGWDVSLYAWGFSAAALWLSAGVVMLLACYQWGAWVWQAVVLLALYAVLRWPTGNTWDAWLDPAVWLCAHVQVVRHVARFFGKRRHV